MAFRSAHRRALVPYRPTVKPIVIRTTKVVKKKTKHRRSGGGMGGLFGGNKGKVMMGAFLLGLIQKQGFASSLPTIPVLGQTGTIGLAAHFLGGRSPLAQDIATAAFAVAAWEMGHDGHIIGEDEGDIWG